MADLAIVEREEWEIEAERAMQSLSRKKVATIIAVVTAKIQGKKLREVFADPDTRPCNIEVFWRWRREDEEFQEAYATVEKIAFGYADRTSIGELRSARRSLARSTSLAVARLRTLLMSSDERIQLAAANSILDRANEAMLKPDGEGEGGDFARRMTINSDTMADLIRAAREQRGNLIADDGN